MAHSFNTGISEAQYRLFYEFNPTMYFTVASDGRILSVNSFGASELGYSVDELLGTDVLSIFHPEDKHAVASSLEKVVASSPQNARWEFRKLHKEGQVIWVREDVNVIKDSSGENIFLVVCQNINEEKAAAEELARKNDALGQANRDLEQIAYAASHDLRQPLRVVMGAMQLLRKRYLEHFNAEDRELLDLGETSVLKMSRLMDDLLLYTQLNMAQLDFRPVSIEDVLKNVIAKKAETIHRAGARVEFDRLPMIVGDKKHLEVLLDQLIGNALKFQHNDPPRIQVSARRVGEEWVVEVRDNGIGFEPEYSDYVLGVFKRLHNDSRFEGTGIGLAIAKKIMELHNGRLWLESVPGEGARVFLAFPEK